VFAINLPLILKLLRTSKTYEVTATHSESALSLLHEKQLIIQVLP